MSFIVRNPNAVAFILADDDLYYEFAASESSVDLEEIFSWQKLYNSSIGSGALLAAITNGDIIRRNTSDTADIAAGNAFDDAIWRWQLSKDQTDALLGSFGAPSTSNRYVTYSDPVLFTQNVVKVELNPRPGEFSSIGAAMASITTASPTSNWIVEVGPGLFIEDTITVKSYVTVKGQGISTIVAVNAPTKDLFVMSTLSRLSSMALTGATGTGKALIRVTSVIDVYSSDLYFGNAYHFIVVESTTAPALFVSERNLIRPSSVFNQAFVTTSSGGFQSLLFLHNLTGKSAGSADTFFRVIGPNAELSIVDITFRVETAGSCVNGIYLEDGASVFGSSCILQKFDTGLNIPNVGAGPKLSIGSLTMLDSTVNDLVISNPGTSGLIVGIWRNDKVIKDSAATVALTGANPNNSFYVNQFEVQTKDVNVVLVRKNPGPNDFDSIVSALASITTASSTNQFIVDVGPGTFTEGTITLKPYVSVRGFQQETLVQVDDPSKDLFVMSPNSTLGYLSLTGSTDPGKALIKATNCLAVAIDNITFYEGDYLVYATDGGFTTILAKNCFIPSVAKFTTAFRCESYLPNRIITLFSGISGRIADSADQIFYVEGDGTTVASSSLFFIAMPPAVVGAAVELTDGATFTGDSFTFEGFQRGVILNAGTVGSNIRMTSTTIYGEAFEGIKIDDPLSTGYITGVWDNESVSKVSGSLISLAAADPDNSFYVNQSEVETRDVNVVHVRKNPGPNDFATIADALASITTASMSNQYLIDVGPGVYIEDTLVMKSYISITGVDRNTVIVQIDDPDKFLFETAIFSSISHLTVRGGTNATGGLIFGKNGTFGTFSVRDLTIGNAYTIVNLTAANFCQVVFFNCLTETSAQWTNAFVLDHPTGMNILTLLDFNYQVVNAVNDFIYVSGPNCQINVSISSGLVAAALGGSVAQAIRIADGGTFRCSNFSLIGAQKGLLVENIGTGPKLNIANLLLTGTTSNSVRIEHPGTTGFIDGAFATSQVFVDASANVSIAFSDPTGSNIGFNVIGALLQGDSYQKIINVTKLLRATSTLGLISGGMLSDGGGLNVAYDAGTGFTQDEDDIVREVTWVAGSILINTFEDVYLTVDANGLVQAEASYDQLYKIVLGRVISDDTAIRLLEQAPIHMDHRGNSAEDFFRTALGPIYSSGSLVTENVTPYSLNVGAGVYYFGTNKYAPSGGTGIGWIALYQDGIGGWANTIQVSITLEYDDGSGTLAPIPSGQYAKHSLYTVGEGAYEAYALIFAQTFWGTLVEAEEAVLPTPPPFIRDSVVRISSIIVQEGAPNIIQVRDERPRIGFSASGVSASAVHGNLLGLDANDHPQYLLRDGSAAMTGALNMGANSITNVNLVDGIDVSTHAARHLPNGADPLTTAIAFNVGANNVASIGTANALSRSDHIHAAITGVPSTQTPDQANAAGAGNALARADHVHNIPTAIAVAVGSANAQGAAATFARADHVHEGVHGIRANASAYNFGNVTLQDGLGVTIVDGGSGVLTISTPSALFNTVFHVTYPGTGLSVDYTGGHIRINDVLVNVASGSHLLAASEAGEIYVDPAGAVLATIGGGTTPANYYPLAAYTTSATAVTALTDLRVWVNQNLVWGTSGNVTSIVPDDTASAGTSDNYARADHRHAISATAPTTSLSATTTNSEGVANSFARGDHTHAILTATVSSQTPDQANAAGTSASLARADHVHNIPTAAAVGLDASSVNGQGAASTFSRADHTHAIATGLVGNIAAIVPDASASAGVLNSFARADHVHAISCDAPTTPLSATTTNAEGAGTAFSRNDHTHSILTGVVSGQTPDQANAAGTSANLARADHVHNIPTAVAVAVGASNGQGVAATFSRADHVHEGVHGIRANLDAYNFGDVTLQDGPGISIADAGSGVITISVPALIYNTVFHATYPGTGLSVDYTGGNARVNDTFYTVASGSTALTPSTSGEIYVGTSGVVAATISGLAAPDNTYPFARYTTDGTSITLLTDSRTWVSQNLVYGGTTDISIITPDTTRTPGVQNRYARADHTHGITAGAPTTSLSATTTNDEGIGSSFARADHVHAILTGAASTQTPDQTNDAGTSANLARADHVHNIPTAAAVGLNAASTNTQGAAATFARADHTHAISAGITADITTIQPDATAAAGTSTAFARADHRHAIDTAAAASQTADAANAEGVSTSFARADHVHNIATAAPTTSLSATTTNAQGAASTFAKSDHSHAILTGVVSTQNPDQANAAGTSANLARADHIHNIPTAVAVDITTANAQGASTSFARADHTHRGIRSLAVNAGTQRFGNINFQNGSGVTVVDDGAGNFTFDTIAGSNELVVTNGGGLVANYSAGLVLLDGAFTSIAAGNTTVGASITNGFIYVSLAGTVTSGATLPDGAVPLALFTSGVSTITALANRRSMLRQSNTPGASGDIVTIQPDATASAGTSERWARADHRHAIDAAAAVSQTPDQANAEGVSTSFARADHVHAIATAAPTTSLSATTTNAQGAASTFARSDHGHAILTATAVGLDATSASGAGTSASLARADHTHALATGVVSTQTPDQANAAGTSANLARADHVHNIPTAAAVGLNAASTNTQGAAATFARADHTHAILAGITADITTIVPDASAAAGTSNAFARADHVHAIAAAAAAAQTADAANAEGVSTSFARADHVHNIATAAPTTNLSATTTNAQGAATTFSKSDHSHAITTGAASAQTPDQANAAGTSASLARADHVHNIATAAPTTSLSATTTNAQGAASTFARSDHGHAILTGVVSAQTPDQANAAGTSANLARADHIHNIATAAAVSLTTSSTNAQGAASTFARSDHTHAISLVNSHSSSVALITTTSSTYVLMTGQTTTPVSGTYYVMGRSTVSATSNGRTIGLSIYVAGSIIASSETTTYIRTGSGFLTATDIQTLVTTAVVTVNGSQAVELRWNTNGGTAQAQGYSLALLKLNN